MRQILVSMPWTRDTAVDEFAFAERAVLVLAYIGDGADLGLAALGIRIFVHGHSLAGEADYFRSVNAYIAKSTDFNETIRLQ